MPKGGTGVVPVASGSMMMADRRMSAPVSGFPAGAYGSQQRTYGAPQGTYGGGPASGYGAPRSAYGSYGALQGTYGAAHGIDGSAGFHTTAAFGAYAATQSAANVGYAGFQR